MSKLFLNLDAKEEKRLNWLIGFFVGTHVVAPTFKNRQEWDKDRIVQELQSNLFDAVFDKFMDWLKKRNESPSYAQDAEIYKKIAVSEMLQTEIKSLIYVKIPKLAKNYDDERNGLTTRRLIKEQVTDANWKILLIKFNHQCVYCGNEESITKDHIIPISKGGQHEFNNLVPACSSCNSRKSNHSLDEWYTKQSFYSPTQHEKIIEHMGSDQF